MSTKAPIRPKKQYRHTVCLTETQLALEKEVLRHHGYPSPTAYYLSSLRHAGITMTEHSITKDWDHLSPEEQEELDLGILCGMLERKALKGSFLRKVIYDLIVEINGEGAQFPRVKQVEARTAAAVKSALLERAREKPDN
jgi:hypothetical protein